MEIKTNASSSEILDNIKNIIQNEIKSLPQTLEQFEPKQRVEVLIKLLPFILPKVDKIEQNIFRGCSGIFVEE